MNQINHFSSFYHCQSWGSGFKLRPGQKFGSRFLFHVRH